MAFSFVMILFLVSVLVTWWYYLLNPDILTTTTIATTTTRKQQVRIKTGKFAAHRPDETTEDNSLRTAVLTTTPPFTIPSTPRTPVENAICEQFILNRMYYPMCLKLVEDCLRDGKRITLSHKNVPGCI